LKQALSLQESNKLPEAVMGERLVFQPLTTEDKITVVIYRIGIVLSTLIICGLAYIMAAGVDAKGRLLDVLGYSLQVSVGLCCLFIHLYVGIFKKYLRNVYFISFACFAVLLFLGKGSLSAALTEAQVRSVLLLPLVGCLGFVTAKEAFCFRLREGYLIAVLMPIYVLLIAGGIIGGQAVVSGMVSIAALLVFFTLRKAFMPLAYDIGDKTAYR